MNIVMSKSERKTLFSGTRYVLHTKIEATPEEARFCRKTGLERKSLFDNIERLVGERAYMRLLKRSASFPMNYMGRGMDNEFEELAALRNFEGIMTRSLESWKRQVELHQ